MSDEPKMTSTSTTTSPASTHRQVVSPPVPGWPGPCPPDWRMSSGGLPIRDIVGARLRKAGRHGAASRRVDLPFRAGDAQGVDVAESRAVDEVARRGLAGSEPLRDRLGARRHRRRVSVLRRRRQRLRRGERAPPRVGRVRRRTSSVSSGCGSASPAPRSRAAWSDTGAGGPAHAVRARPRVRACSSGSGRTYPSGSPAASSAQFCLVALLELPLVPFVPHLFHRLGQPARSLVANVHGPGLVVLGLLRLRRQSARRGAVLPGAAAARRSSGVFAYRLGRAAVPVAVVVVGLVFGLAHFEALEFPALAGFGIVLGALATKTGRLGTGNRRPRRVQRRGVLLGRGTIHF